MRRAWTEDKQKGIRLDGTCKFSDIKYMAYIKYGLVHGSQYRFLSLSHASVGSFVSSFFLTLNLSSYYLVLPCICFLDCAVYVLGSTLVF